MFFNFFMSWIFAVSTFLCHEFLQFFHNLHFLNLLIFSCQQNFFSACRYVTEQISETKKWFGTFKYPIRKCSFSFWDCQFRQVIVLFLGFFYLFWSIKQFHDLCVGKWVYLIALNMCIGVKASTVVAMIIFLLKLFDVYFSNFELFWLALFNWSYQIQ